MRYSVIVLLPLTIMLSGLLPQDMLLELGRGTADYASWTEDGHIRVMGSQGLWLYDENFQLVSQTPFTDPLTLWYPSYFVTQSDDNLATFWRADQAFWDQQFPNRLTAALMGENLHIFAFDTHIEIWSLDALQQRLEGHSAPITALTLLDNDLLASADSSGRLIFWNIRTGATLINFQAHEGAVQTMAWNGTQLATGGEDGIIKIWDAAGQPLKTLEGHIAPVNALSWRTDGVLASGSGHNFEGSEVRIWDIASGEPIGVFGASGAITQVEWHGTRLLGRGEDNMVRIWEENGQPLSTLQGHMDAVESVAWSPDGAEIVCGNDDGQLRIWDAATGEILITFQGHKRGVTSVDWSPDGQFIASGGWDNAVRVWLRETGKTRRVLKGHTGRVWAVEWHPQGRIVASASQDMTVRLWDALTGETLHILRGAESDMNDVAWSPDGTQIAGSSEDGTVWVWDAATGAVLQKLAGHNRYVFALAWHPSQNVLLSGSWYDDLMLLWDTETGKRLAEYNSPRLYALDWHPAGTAFASGDDQGIIRLWEEGKVVEVFDDHTGAIYGLAWNPDGTRLASASADGSLRIWGN